MNEGIEKQKPKPEVFAMEPRRCILILDSSDQIIVIQNLNLVGCQHSEVGHECLSMLGC